MGTTAEKLAYLSGTKAAIKGAIVDSGVDVPAVTPFRGYAGKVQSIVGQFSDELDVIMGGGLSPTEPGKLITPNTAEQLAISGGVLAAGDIKVAGDPNLVPANIAKGVTIFGVAGSYSGAEPVYEIVPPENISFETAGSPIRITINLSRNVYAVYGLSLWVGIIEERATATFSYPASGLGEPDESAVFRTMGTSVSIYTLSVSGNSLYLTRTSDSRLSGKTLDTQFGATVYYAPM